MRMKSPIKLLLPAALTLLIVNMLPAEPKMLPQSTASTPQARRPR